MKNKLRKLIFDCKNITSNTKIMLNYIKHNKKGNRYFVIKFLQSIITAFFPLVLMTLPGLLINVLIQDQLNIRVCIIYVSLLVFLPVLYHYLSLWMNYGLKKIKLQIELDIDVAFYKHLSQMDYEIYESPEIQIKKNRSKEALNKVWQVSEILFGFITQIISLVTVIIVVSFLNPILVCIVIAFSLLLSIIKKRIVNHLHALEQKSSEYDRRLWGVTFMLDQQQYAKEIRLFDISDFLLQEYRSITQELILMNMKYFGKKNVPTNFDKCFELIQNICIYAFLVFRVVKQVISIGNFTIYLSYYSRFKGALNDFLSSFINLAQISLNVDELNEFMDLPIKIHASGDLHVRYTNKALIEFKNVSFKYPGSEVYALKDINLTIHFNEKLCVVGPNGAGKSTFIKLLTRLYVPTNGEILLNGKNIAEYDDEEYMRLFSPVFQDFVRYYFSLGANIALTKEYDVSKLDQIIKECHLESLLKKLPKGYETQVGKWFDGEGFEPSGGEDQRIAIARALYKEREIYILDEPTAALDPDAEYEIYHQFNQMIQNKTAVLVTHRLSAVQLADNVAVFDNGEIIEYGSHDQLYALGGKYRSMFDKQAKFYRDVSRGKSDASLDVTP